MENKGIFMSLLVSWIVIGLIGILIFVKNTNEEPVLVTEPTQIVETVFEATTQETTQETVQETVQETESTVSTTTPITEPQPTINEFESTWEESAIYLAKTIWGEARGCSKEEQEKVAWCILNRVDNPNFPDTIKGVVTCGAFHGYSKSFPCEEELYDMALNIIFMWQQEKNGEIVNRTLEPNMYYMSAKSDGSGHNFRENWN